MSAIQALLQELEHEAQTTRRVLERVPRISLGWKPHTEVDVSRPVALHVAIVPGGDRRDAQLAVPAPQFNQPSATTSAELVRTLDTSIAKAGKSSADLDDAGTGRDVADEGGDRECWPCRAARSSARSC